MAKIVLNRPPIRTTRDYRLLLEARQFPNVIDLSCYGVGQPEPDRTNPVRANSWCIENGRRRPRRITIFGAQVREWSIPILLPEGAGFQWSELEVVAGKPCDREYFLVPDCADDEHFFRLTQGVLDEVEMDGLWVEARDGDGAPLTSLANLHSPRIIRYDALEAVEVQVEAAALNAIAWRTNPCEECTEDDLINNGLYGGLTLFKSTSDGFVSGTSFTITPVLAVTETVQGIYTEGNLIIAVTADSGAPGGRILVSTDGQNFVNAAPGGAPDLYAVTRAGNYYIVVGDAGTIYRSLDAFTWSLVPNTLAPTAVLRAVAHDPSTSITYIAGEIVATTSGVALTLRENLLQDMTAQLPGAHDSLNSVRVLEPNHVAFGGLIGTTGYFAENPKASAGGTYSQGSVGAAAITAILGDAWRTIVATGTKLFTRSVFSDMTFKTIPYAANTVITGNYTAGAAAVGEIGGDIFAFVTGTGEIVVVAPKWDSQLRG